MLCIFCEKDSQDSVSVEHIIPESLGNNEHILPRGIVCDKCNNYFASKVEEPVLNSLFFRNLRGRQQVANKRGKVPPQLGLFPLAQIPISLISSSSNGISVGAWNESDNKRFIETIRNSQSGAFYVPLGPLPTNRALSRFLAKIAVEIFAQNYLQTNMSTSGIIDSAQLVPIRRFVRIGDAPKEWPISNRNIYYEEKRFSDGIETYQVLHEYNLLVTDESEIYAVVCIFGKEFAINLGGPSIEGYERWLEAHDNQSPLYQNAIL